MNRISMRIALFFIFLQIQCINTKNQDLRFLLIDSEKNPKSYFSFPGRYSDPQKKEEVKKRIIEIIQNTKRKLTVFAYSLNEPEMIQEIANAKKRGVALQITLDKDKDYSELKNHKIEFSLWQSSGLHHLKVIVSDDTLVFFGTGNFSKYGLTQDHNGYIEFNLSDSSKFLSMLNDTYDNSILFTNEMFFLTSPKDGRRIQSQIIREIRNAKKSVHYLIFDHFDPLISLALKEASSRGVEVIGVYDHKTDEEGIYLKDSYYGLLSEIYRDGNEDITETDQFTEGGLLHHKTMIVDEKKLLVGSYNYSLSARDNNREIFMQTEMKNLVKDFSEEFHRVKEKSYKLNPENFYSKKNLEERTFSKNEKEISFEGIEIEKPIIELGEGVFKTFLYYPEFRGSKIINYNTFHPISSNFSYPQFGSFLGLDEFWEKISVHGRSSNRVFKMQLLQKESIFQKTKPLNKIQIDFFDLTDSGKILLSTNSDNLENRNIIVFFPDDNLRYATLTRQPLADEHTFSGDLQGGSLSKKTGIAFIEKDRTIDFFCFRKSTDSQKKSIEEFLSEWAVFQSFAENRQVEKPSCTIY